jgi:hypothetical protein
VVPAAESREYLEWRFTQLSRLLAAHEPGTRAAALRGQLEDALGRIDARAPIGRRLVELEEAIAALGLIDAGDRHVAALLAARVRWAGPDDFSHVALAPMESPR